MLKEFILEKLGLNDPNQRLADLNETISDYSEILADEQIKPVAKNKMIQKLDNLSKERDTLQKKINLVV